MIYSQALKTKLFQLIDKMALTPADFAADPQKHLKRTRKLPFPSMMRSILSFGTGCLREELLSFFSFSATTATTSAFCQQRAKIKPEAFHHLFLQFTSGLPKDHKYHGYDLIACDGSAADIPLDPREFAGSKYDIQRGTGHRSFFQMHLHTLYDLCNQIYLDVKMEPEKASHEKTSMIDMILRGRFSPKTIFIADRGYESYNIFAHIQHQNLFYLIRVKDGSNGGIVRGYPRPDTEEYDISFRRIITHRKNKEIEKRKDVYVYSARKYQRDFFVGEHEFYELNFRIVRVKVQENTYECFITNLPSDDFPLEEVKKLYHLRWGIETAFRDLKHTIGLTAFHAKKMEFIVQEIYARMILYNFSSSVTKHTVITHKKRKYTYKINLAMAIRICRHFLNTDETPPNGIEELLAKELTPVRLDRSFPRHKRYQRAKYFVYRAS